LQASRAFKAAGRLKELFSSPSVPGASLTASLAVHCVGISSIAAQSWRMFYHFRLSLLAQLRQSVMTPSRWKAIGFMGFLLDVLYHEERAAHLDNSTRSNRTQGGHRTIECPLIDDYLLVTKSFPSFANPRKLLWLSSLDNSPSYSTTSSFRTPLSYESTADFIIRQPPQDLVTGQCCHGAVWPL